MLGRMRHYVSVADRELQKGEATDWGIVDGALKAANEVQRMLRRSFTLAYRRSNIQATQSTPSPKFSS
jgi:hypothetical protein